MKEIRLMVDFHISQQNYQERISLREQIIFAKTNLAQRLAEVICAKSDFFKVSKETCTEITYHAECYVLTPSDFCELVKQIKKDIEMGHLSMIGGVS